MRFLGCADYSGCPQEPTDSSSSGASQQAGEGYWLVLAFYLEVVLTPPHSETSMAGRSLLDRAYEVDEIHGFPNTNNSPAVAIWEEEASNAETQDPGHP